MQEGRRTNIKTPNWNQFDVLKNQNENQNVRNEAGVGSQGKYKIRSCRVSWTLVIISDVSSSHWNQSEDFKLDKGKTYFICCKRFYRCSELNGLQGGNVETSVVMYL